MDLWWSDIFLHWPSWPLQWDQPGHILGNQFTMNAPPPPPPIPIHPPYSLMALCVPLPLWVDLWWWSKVWSRFFLYHCIAVFNIVLYWNVSLLCPTVFCNIGTTMCITVVDCSRPSHISLICMHLPGLQYWYLFSLLACNFVISYIVCTWYGNKFTSYSIFLYYVTPSLIDRART